MFIEKSNILKSQNDQILSSKENRYNNFELPRKPFGPINSEL